MQTKLKYAFFFIFGIAISASYFLFQSESISLTPLKVEVIIKNDSYLIGDKKGQDLITLINNIRSGTNHVPIIVLDADETISYSRVAETMDILKNEGYGTVGLATHD